ncbi:MAG: winged helix-turn-helix domain-containing protein [Methylophilaceae bacterium]
MDNKLALKESNSYVRRKLSDEQELAIFAKISRRRPFYYGFSSPYKNVQFTLWTRDLVKKLIDNEFKVNLTNADVVNFLKRWGFPPLNRQESKLDQCPKVIKEWLSIEMDNLIERSIAEKAQIYWMGHIASVGLSHSHPRAQKGLRMVSAIQTQGRLLWMIVRGPFTPKRQVMLLKSLVGQSRTKVFLIRQNLKHFNNESVCDWLKENKASLEIFPPAEWRNE